MKTKIKILLTLMIGMSDFNLNSAFAGEAYSRCLKNDSNKCTFFFQQNQNTEVYDHPGGGGSARWRANSGVALRIDWTKTRLAQLQSWAYVDNGGQHATGWLRVEDIAGYGDFRKVVRCWPVTSLSDEDDRLGDFMLLAEFTKDGAGTITSEGQKVHVWFTPDLILIGRHPDLNGYVYGFDKASNTFYQPIHAYKVDSVVTKNVSASCSAGFVVK